MKWLQPTSVSRWMFSWSWCGEAAEAGPVVAAADGTCPAGAVVKPVCNYQEFVNVSVVPFLSASYFSSVRVNKPNVSVYKGRSSAVRKAFCTNSYN